MSTWTLPRLYPKQHAVFYTPERIVVCEASTKSGKSAGALTWLLSLALRSKGSHLWVSPVIPQAEVMFNRLVRMLAQSDPKGMDWEKKAQDRVIRIRGAGSIWFKGGDNADSIYGSDYEAALVDEASRVKEDAWHAVRSTLSATGGPVRVIGNVKGRRNWAYNLARKAEGGEPGMAFHRLTWRDSVEAGIFPASEVEDARRALPEAIFRQLYEAVAADDVGNPFGIEAIARCVKPASTQPAACWGLDLAKAVDWTVGVGLDRNRQWTAVHRFQAPWKETTDRALGFIGNTRCIADSTGVGDPIVETLQRRGGNVESFKFTSASKQQIMEGLALSIQSGDISIPDGQCRLELESFEYEYTRTGVRYAAPEGMNDDCVCALALANSGILGAREPGVSVVFAGGEQEDDDPW